MFYYQIGNKTRRFCIFVYFLNFAHPLKSVLRCLSVIFPSLWTGSPSTVVSSLRNEFSKVWRNRTILVNLRFKSNSLSQLRMHTNSHEVPSGRLLVFIFFTFFWVIRKKSVTLPLKSIITQYQHLRNFNNYIRL